MNWFFFSLIYDVIFQEDDDEHDEQSSMSFALKFKLSDVTHERGTQIRIVVSSDADANIDG